MTRHVENRKVVDSDSDTETKEFQRESICEGLRYILEVKNYTEVVCKYASTDMSKKGVSVKAICTWP